MKELIDRDSVKGLTHILKVRQILMIFFIAVFVCSVQIASFHHHDGLIVRTDCPVCKFLTVFPSGGEAAVHPVITPDFVRIFFAPENPICFFAILTVVLSNRAPPYPVFTHNYFKINNCTQQM